jgi:RNA polymerase sigma-70 factor (ECF subfamily)
VAPLWSDEIDSPERTMLRRHDTETMQRLIMSLPPVFREVIVLREINGLSYSEIAAVIEAPIGTVMSRLARARSVLRDAWIATEDGDIPDEV